MIFSADFAMALGDVAQQVGARQEQLLVQWRRCVEADSLSLGSAHMSQPQFYDHIPLILESFAAKLRLESRGNARETPAMEAQQAERAKQHSMHRWQQGYSVRSLVREWGHLNQCMIKNLDSLQAEASALCRARSLWAEFVTDNLSEGVAEYESLLQSEAGARLGDLEGALETMKTLETERGEILRGVSHDLRGGLSVVTGASSLLGHESISGSDRERVASILQNGVRSVTQMIADLMIMARLEAGHETRQIAAFDAARQLNELADSSRFLAEEKGLFLRTEGPPILLVSGDVAKTSRIAQNLLLNALKYTQNGGAVLSWQEISESQWSFSISDTGPGLDRATAAPLVQKIAVITSEAQAVGAQAPGEIISQTPIQNPVSIQNLAPVASSDELKNSAFQPGEGIGLSIVRRLCELLDATLEIESNEGKGLIFRVILPRVYAEKAV